MQEITTLSLHVCRLRFLYLASWTMSSHLNFAVGLHRQPEETVALYAASCLKPCAECFPVELISAVRAVFVGRGIRNCS